MEPDAIVQNGIKVLQQKLAALIHELNANDGFGGDNGNAEYNGPQSPDYNGLGSAGAGAGAPDSWQDQGYTTPYATGNNQPSWGNGGTTPYGTTPYGNGGGWN